MARVLWKEESKVGPALIHVLRASDSPNPANEQNGKFPHTQVKPQAQNITFLWLSLAKTRWAEILKKGSTKPRENKKDINA